MVPELSRMQGSSATRRRALLFAKRASARAIPETRIDQRAVVTIEPEPDDRIRRYGRLGAAPGATVATALGERDRRAGLCGSAVDSRR